VTITVRPSSAARPPASSTPLLSPDSWTATDPDLSVMPAGAASNSAASRAGVTVMSGRHWLAGGELVRPLLVELAPGDGYLVAREPRTGIHGHGPTPAEAINDLREALVDHRRVLQEAAALSDDLRDQLDILRTHLRPTA
jgi:predicted RNase H-like HicB family nuclease